MTKSGTRVSIGVCAVVLLASSLCGAKLDRLIVERVLLQEAEKRGLADFL